jgi:outer membrane protein TolC
MRRTLLLASIWIAGVAAGNPPAARFRLEEVLRAAETKAKIEDARLDLAQSTLKFLDTQNRWRFEFRPSVNLFAFSNPALLATSLGSGLLFNRRTAPGFAAMDGARFDTLAAEVHAETLRVRVRLEAAQQYFDLLEKQQIAKLAAEVLSRRKDSGKDVARLLQASRITAADSLSYEQELLDLEWQWLSAESERKAAVARLRSIIGADDQIVDFDVEDVAVRTVADGAAVPPLDELVRLALTHRGESKLLREKVHSLATQKSKGKRAAVETAGAGYAYINNSTGVANAMNGNILGGNTGRGDITLNIPLRNNGERAAHEQVTQARIRLLELEIAAMEDSVRQQVAILQDEAAASAERLRLASRRLELARKSAEVQRARADHGLASMTAAWAADAAVLSAESAYTRAAYGRISRSFALRVVCGTDAAGVAGEQILHSGNSE